MRISELLLLAAVLALAACAGPVPQPDTAMLDTLIEERTGITSPAAGTDDTVAALLSAPLTVDDAMRIAFINNPRMRRAYARLGIAAADVFDASRLSNPSLSLGALESNVGTAVMRITATLMQNVTDVVMRPDRRAIAERQARQTAFAVGADLWELAQDVGAAHVTAVAARQRADLRTLAARATGLAAELAQRYFDAGNINRLELSLAEAAVSQARLDATMAEAAADTALIRLRRLLGLHGAAEILLPTGLRLPVASEDDPEQLRSLALAGRLDLQAADAAIESARLTLDLNRRYRYLGSVEAGVEFERDDDESRYIGPNLNLELPLFNQGQGRIARAGADLERQQALRDELALAAEHAVAVAHTQVLAARQRVEIYRTQFVPARRDIVQRTREMQNFMIVSPFESLRARTAEYDAYSDYIDALGDYWLARVALTREVGTALPSTPAAGGARLDTSALTEPEPASTMPHAGHRHHSGEAR